MYFNAHRLQVQSWRGTKRIEFDVQNNLFLFFDLEERMK